MTWLTKTADEDMTLLELAVADFISVLGADRTSMIIRNIHPSDKWFVIYFGGYKYTWLPVNPADFLRHNLRGRILEYIATLSNNLISKMRLPG